MSFTPEEIDMQTQPMASVDCEGQPDTAMTSKPIADSTHKLVFLARTQLNEGKAAPSSATLPAQREVLQQRYANGRLLVGGPLVTNGGHGTGNSAYFLVPRHLKPKPLATLTGSTATVLARHTFSAGC